MIFFLFRLKMPERTWFEGQLCYHIFLTHEPALLILECAHRSHGDFVQVQSWFTKPASLRFPLVPPWFQPTWSGAPSDNSDNVFQLASKWFSFVQWLYEKQSSFVFISFLWGLTHLLCVPKCVFYLGFESRVELMPHVCQEQIENKKCMEKRIFFILGKYFSQIKQKISLWNY